MNRFIQRSAQSELIDEPGIPFSDWEVCLNELNTVNTFLGGHKITIEGVKLLLNELPAGKRISICEIGCGGGDNLKAVVEGVDGSGQPIHNEWTGKFDGKDYPVTGDKITDTRAVQQVDATHFKLTGKKDGKVVTTGTIVTSADGKTRTLNVKAKDASGKAVTATFVYDKQ